MKIEELTSLFMELHSMKFKKSWKLDAGLVRKYIKPAWEGREINSITRLDVEIFVTNISKAHPTQANRVLSLLQVMFQKATEWEILTKNPAKDVRRTLEKPRRRVASEEELRRLFETLRKEKPVLRAYFTLFLLLGCRRGELASLRWSDVDFTNRLVTFRETKNGKPHVLPLTDEALVLLAGLPRSGEWVFTQKLGCRFSEGGRHIWDRICKLAGINGLHIHDLRRTFASRLASSGVNLTIIRDALNHSSVRVTQVYTVISQENLRDVMNANSAKLSNRLLKLVK